MHQPTYRGFCVQPSGGSTSFPMCGHDSLGERVLGPVTADYSFENEEPPTSPSTKQSTLQPKLTKIDRTFESNEYTSYADSPPGQPRRRCSIDLSPTTVTAFVNDSAFAEIPLIPNDEDETDSPLHARIAQLPQERRGVRFVVDEDGEIDEDITLRSYPTHQLTPEDIAICWYSKAERSKIKAGILTECRECVRDIPQYRRSALKVCALASRKDYAKNIAGDSLAALRVVTQASARGLERPMLTRMLLPRKSGRQNVYAVLRTQMLIHELDDSMYTMDDKAGLIAEQYETNSQYAIRWAHILALGDADETGNL